MKRERANKFIDKRVKITFKQEWFNEAVQEWVLEDEEIIGILLHPSNETQKHLYCLKRDKCSSTDNACWSANCMKKIEEMSL